jgi:hypothetical protein
MEDTEYNKLGHRKLSLKFKWQRPISQIIKGTSMNYVVPLERTVSDSLENLKKKKKKKN